MAWTYDPTSSIGKVRLRIPDTDESTAVLTDEEIQAFLDDNGDDYRLATAEALEMIAGQEALVGKMIGILGVSTNGAYVANSLLQRAAKLREGAEFIEVSP
jgi:hypothetical protein